MNVLAILSLKGGVGKTTSALYLAAVASTQGRHVTVIDLDSERSACRWAQHLLLPFAVQPCGFDRLNQQVQVAQESGGLAIIDTPPNSRDLLLRAGTLADHAVVPVAPSGLDMDRLRPTLEWLADLQLLRPELDVAILMTRHNTRRRLAREAQQALTGLPVLRQCVHEREVYEAAFGALPAPLGDYQAVWAELQP